MVGTEGSKSDRTPCARLSTNREYDIVLPYIKNI